MGIFFALLKALPQLLTLVSAIWHFVEASVAKAEGRKEAIAEALAIATGEINRAARIKAEADTLHAAHPDSDEGFDSEFQRKDS